MKLGNLWIASVGAALLGGCASAAVPVQRVASSEAAIRAAQEVGAAQSPEAALHLRLAQEQLNTAKKLISDGENRRAEWVLLRAQADSEVALAIAREEREKVEAQKALDQVRATRAQNQQSMGQKGTES